MVFRRAAKATRMAEVGEGGVQHNEQRTARPRLSIDPVVQSLPTALTRDLALQGRCRGASPLISSSEAESMEEQRAARVRCESCRERRVSRRNER